MSNSVMLMRSHAKAPNRSYIPELDSIKVIVSLKLECDTGLTALQRKEYEKLAAAIYGYESAIATQYTLQQHLRSRKNILMLSAGDHQYLKKAVMDFDRLNYYFSVDKEQAVNDIIQVSRDAVGRIKEGFNPNYFDAHFVRDADLGSLSTPALADSKSNLSNLQTIVSVRSEVESCFSKLKLDEGQTAPEVFNVANKQIGKVRDASCSLSGVVASDLPTTFKPNPERGKPLKERIDWGLFLNPKIDRYWTNINVNPRFSVLYKHTSKWLSSVGFERTIIILRSSERDLVRPSSNNIVFQSEYKLKGILYGGLAYRAMYSELFQQGSPSVLLTLRNGNKSPRSVVSVSFNLLDEPFGRASSFSINYGIEF